jgi:hypothetical protein
MAKAKYKVDKLTREEIKDYARYLLGLINHQFLEDNRIYKNEFLEYIYFFCENQYTKTGNYELSQDDVGLLVIAKKHNDSICEELKNGDAFLIGISKDDNLIFEFKNQDAFDKYHMLKKENE